MITQNIKQEQKLSLLQTQLNTILTMQDYELRAYVNNEIRNNPIIDLDKYERITYSKKVSADSLKKSDDYYDFLNSLSTNDESLYTHLEKQLFLQKLNDDELEIGKLIISNLNQSGYLILPEDELLSALKIKDKHQIFIKVLGIIQKLEPEGCGAIDAYDTLKIQLKNHYGNNQLFNLANQLINKDDFIKYERKNLNFLKKKYNATEKNIEDAFKIIRSLDYQPGKKYSNELNRDIVPIITIKVDNGIISVETINDKLPDIEINEEFLNTEDKNALKIKNEYKKKLNTLLNFLDIRKRTIYKIAHYMIMKQKNFIIFNKKKEGLKLDEIAANCDISISTASRIINTNYMQYNSKIIPFKELLEQTNEMQNGEKIQKSEILKIIKTIIEESSVKLSDEKISEMLKMRGIFISRRTVQKYRSSLSIESSYGR